jgi:hypothetical protein
MDAVSEFAVIDENSVTELYAEAAHGKLLPEIVHASQRGISPLRARGDDAVDQSATFGSINTVYDKRAFVFFNAQLYRHV